MACKVALRQKAHHLNTKLIGTHGIFANFLMLNLMAVNTFWRVTAAGEASRAQDDMRDAELDSALPTVLAARRRMARRVAEVVDTRRGQR